MLIARQADTQLTEFAAFTYGHNYPHMRRWELPFALYRMRLPNTAAVLDCTVNPLDFGERLRSLYPHVLYRHHNPIQGGRFAPGLRLADKSLRPGLRLHPAEPPPLEPARAPPRRDGAQAQARRPARP